MSLTREAVETLAADFVTEYLERSPEYIDVVEFVGDNTHKNTTDDDLKDVHSLVEAHLDAIAQRFTDRNHS